jgi:hypothetical protein
MCVCLLFNAQQNRASPSKWRNNWGQVAHQVSIKTTPGDPSYSWIFISSCFSYFSGSSCAKHSTCCCSPNIINDDYYRVQQRTPPQQQQVFPPSHSKFLKGRPIFSHLWKIRWWKSISHLFNYCYSSSYILYMQMSGWPGSAIMIGSQKISGYHHISLYSLLKNYLCGISHFLNIDQDEM